MAEESSKKVAPPELFKIHSLVRDVTTRVHRAKSPIRHRANMLLGGGLIRVLYKRPATVTKATLNRLLAELIDKEKRGMLMVTDMTNRRISLSDFSVVKDLPPTPPLPSPPLDTAVTDNKYPMGEPKPMFVDGLPETAEVEAPIIVQRTLPDGEDEGEPEPVAEPMAEPLPETEPEPEVVEPVGEVDELDEVEGTSEGEEPAIVSAKRKRGRRR